MASQADVRQMAAFVLLANSHKASSFLDERLRDGRISSRLTICVDGVFRVRLVSGLVDFEAQGTSTDSEEDALAQAGQAFAAWEYQQTIQLGGDAVVLHPCF
jgi:hypothetical protein